MRTLAVLLQLLLALLLVCASCAGKDTGTQPQVSSPEPAVRETSDSDQGDWWTFRHDERRSGFAGVDGPLDPSLLWEVRLTSDSQLPPTTSLRIGSVVVGDEHNVFTRNDDEETWKITPDGVEDQMTPIPAFPSLGIYVTLDGGGDAIMTNVYGQIYTLSTDDPYTVSWAENEGVTGYSMPVTIFPGGNVVMTAWQDDLIALFTSAGVLIDTRQSSGDVAGLVAVSPSGGFNNSPQIIVPTSSTALLPPRLVSYYELSGDIYQWDTFDLAAGTTGDVNMIAVDSDNTVYVTSTGFTGRGRGGLSAVAADFDSFTWETEDVGIKSGPGIGFCGEDDAVYMYVTDSMLNENRICAYDSDDGSILWRSDTLGGFAGGGVTLSQEGAAYFVDSSGPSIFLPDPNDANSATPIWTYSQLRGSGAIEGVIDEFVDDDGLHLRLYVVDNLGWLYCFEELL